MIDCHFLKERKNSNNAGFEFLTMVYLLGYYTMTNVKYCPELPRNLMHSPSGSNNPRR